jgi:hypothetical protein
MVSLQQIPSFVEWFFGKEFAGQLEARKAVEPEPRPTAFEGFVPQAVEEAFWTGYTLGYDGEQADHPADFSRRLALSFRAGWKAGDRQLDRDQIADMLDRRERFEEIMAGECEESDRWGGGMS